MATNSLQPRSLLRILREAIGIYRARLIQLLAISIAATAVSNSVLFLWARVRQPYWLVEPNRFAELSADDPFAVQRALEQIVRSFQTTLPSLLLTLLLLLFGLLVTGMYAYMIGGQYIQIGVSLPKALTFSLRRLGLAAGASLLALLAPILSGIVLIGVPALTAVLLGLIHPIFGVLGLLLLLVGLFAWMGLFVSLLVRLSFVQEVAYVEGVGPLRAVARSWQLTRGSWWRVLGYFVLVYGIVGTIDLILSMIFSPGFFADPKPSLPLIVWGIAIGPLQPLVWFLLYADLRGRKEGLSSEQLAQDMGLIPRPP